MANKKIGRPTDLSPEVIERIAEAVVRGNYLDVSASYAGVPKTTFYRWCRKGNDQIKKGEKGLHRDLIEALDLALAQAESNLIDIIHRASERSWQAAGWIAERRFRDRWAQQAKNDGPTDTPVTITITGKKGVSLADVMSKKSDA